MALSITPAKFKRKKAGAKKTARKPSAVPARLRPRGMKTQNRQTMEDGLYKNLTEYSDIPADALILDVRDGGEHSEMALRRRHCLVELPRLDAGDFVRQYGLKGETVYILCKSGMRASAAARKFERAGYGNVSVISGGISARSGNPAIVHRSRISMERQVRIAAGTLALAGSALALAWNPLFAFLPLFVGGGLVFAGVSNTCAMASLLAKLPWNR